MNNYFKLFALCLGLGFIVSCSSDDPVEPPLASFTATVSDSDNLTYNFENQSLRGDSYAWDFGDNTGTSTDMSPEPYTYAAAGTYTVKLTATNEGGTHTFEVTLTVTANAPVNLIANGGFDDDSNWSVVNHYKSDNTDGSVVIADGVATWTEVAGSGWKHMGMYQEIQLEAGTYKTDMHVEYADIDQIWGEVYVGTTIPTSGTATDDSDYTDNRVLFMLNAWDCNKSYSGSAVSNACNTEKDGSTFDGTFTVDAPGTFYLLIKVGGATYGPNGVKVDDVTLYKQ